MYALKPVYSLGKPRQHFYFIIAGSSILLFFGRCQSGAFEIRSRLWQSDLKPRSRLRQSCSRIWQSEAPESNTTKLGWFRLHNTTIC